MRRLGSLRYLIVCAALLLGSIIVCTGFLVASFRERSLADTERELRNTALIIAEQLVQLALGDAYQELVLGTGSPAPEVFVRQIDAALALLNVASRRRRR